jgi:hypothetical protein
MRALHWAAIALLLIIAVMNALDTCSCGSTYRSRRALAIHRAKRTCTPHAPPRQSHPTARRFVMPPRVPVHRPPKIRRTKFEDVTEEPLQSRLDTGNAPLADCDADEVQVCYI